MRCLEKIGGETFLREKALESKKTLERETEREMADGEGE
jgi:hypothetical protein